MDSQADVTKRINTYFSNITDALESKIENSKAGTYTKKDERIGGWMSMLKQEIEKLDKLNKKSPSEALQINLASISKRYKTITEKAQCYIDRCEEKFINGNNNQEMANSGNDEQMANQLDDKLKTQDEKLTLLHEKFQIINDVGKNIAHEMKTQAPLINTIDKGNVNNYTSIALINNKMKKMIAHSNNCQLWMIVALEVLVLTVLLIM